MTTETIIKEKIKTKLQALADVAQVLDFPSQDFNSYPAVSVAYEGNKSEYETNTENSVIYNYSLYVFQIYDGVFDKLKSRLLLEELSGIICDAFDSDEFLLGISLPVTRTMLGINPTTNNIGEDDSGKYALAKITILVRMSKRN
jgi:hypothetical protein